MYIYGAAFEVQSQVLMRKGNIHVHSKEVACAWLSLRFVVRHDTDPLNTLNQTCLSCMSPEPGVSQAVKY